MPFSELDPKIQTNLKKMGFETATQIQKEAIPLILEGNDLFASAKTGSGKTAAFMLPAIEQVINTPRPAKMHPVVLVLAPTRELAMQISSAATEMMQGMKQRCVSIYGGQDYRTQLRFLSKGCEILVATPGRLLDLVEQKQLHLGAVDLLILDEADRMLDMGFSEAVNDILDLLPKKRQTLLFSATIGKKVRKFAEKVLNAPKELTVDSAISTHSQITQSLVFADNLEHKKKLLQHILETKKPGPAIIFTATKRQADTLADHLYDEGQKAAALHGDMKQSRRTKTIARMHKGSLNLLVATDVAARGLDLPALSQVVNFDIPMQAEDYVHRIGRTGRAGKSGDAISLVTAKDFPLLKAILSYTKQDIPVTSFDGLEAQFDPKKKEPSAQKPKKKKPFKGKRRNPREENRSFSQGPKKTFSKKKQDRSFKRVKKRPAKKG